MRKVRRILAVISLVMGTFSANALSQTLEDQQEFARKMSELLNDKHYDYVEAATRKYLELVPDAAPVKRERAAFYMSTTALRTKDGLLTFYYPDGAGQKIIDILNDVIAITPDDGKALSFLVSTHALEGNIELGEQALAKAHALDVKHKSLAYNSALLAISDNRLRDATTLLSTLGVGGYRGTNQSYYSLAWDLQRKIAAAQPEYDTVRSVRNGLATRVLVNDLPEFYSNADPDGPPVLLHFSSQDRRCDVCAKELRAFHEFALQNKQEGSPYQIIYASVEPWRDLYNYTQFLYGMRVNTVPTYLVTNKDEHVATWGGSKSVSSVKLLDNFDSLLANGNISVDVAPRSVYLLDYMRAKFNEYAKSYNGSGSAMAYAIDAGWSHFATTTDQDNQKAAEKIAMHNCQKAVDKWQRSVTCKLYASGDTIVDVVALEHNKARESARERVTRRFAQQKNERIAKEEAERVSKLVPKKTVAKARDKTTTVKTDSSKIVVSRGETIREFLKLNAHYKSLAFAQEGKNFVSGFASEEITQARANEVALDACRAALSLAIDVGAECLLHTIGKSEVTDTSEQAIQKLTSRQQKKNANDSVIGSSYKKYKKLSGDKAYAISIDDASQWAYGMTFRKRGEDEATQAALAECETHRLSKNLSSPCRVLLFNNQFLEQPE